MSSAIKVCNAAAVLLGAGVIQSLEDDTDLSRVFLNLYEPLKHSIMSGYPWTFLKENRYLTRRAGAPIRGYKYAYVIPGDALPGAPHAVFSYQAQRLGQADYTLTNGSIHCNHPELWASIIVDKPENEWPAYFQKAVIHALAADIALVVSDQQSIADRHYQMAYGTPSEGGAGGLIGAAMLIDAQGDGAKGIESDAFVSARFGGAIF